MGIDYAKLRLDVADIIVDLGDGLTATVTHLDGNQSRGNIVFSSTDLTDISIADVGTVQGTDRVAYLNDIRNPICVGDTVTANGVAYRVTESKQYKPATINCGWRVLLDT